MERVILAGIVFCAPLVHPVFATPLTISVAAGVASACRGALVPSMIQSDAEGRLRGVGVIVSNVHNAELAVDVDCVTVNPRTSLETLAVHQCLAFSEVVQTPFSDRRAMLATTWRKCQAYRCNGARCEPILRASQQALIDNFWSDFQERNSADSAPPAQSRPEPPTRIVETRTAGRDVIFALYIMTCLSVLAYWQFRKRAC